LLRLSESCGNEITILVLSCLDPRVTSATYGADRVLLASDFMDL